MKKATLLSAFCALALMASAQFSSTGIYKIYPQIPATSDTVQVFLFDGITGSTDITYTGPGTTFNWYKYDNPNTPVRTGTRDLYPDDASGYILEVDGRKTAIWVIDYKNYLPVLKAISPDPQSANACSELNLLVDATIPQLSYKTPKGSTYALPRTFTLKYATLKWNETATKWNPDSITQTVTLPASAITATAPFCDTRFKLMGDQYAKDLGIEPLSITGNNYTAVRVEGHLKTVVGERKEKNEQSRPENRDPISYSVPIDVEFRSNANEPTASFYEWKIYKDKQLVTTRIDKDHRYTFTDYGTYNVVLKASSSGCSYTDSITINAYEAAIQVPNVFTPNGDGVNDEFRVGYKSLLSFECWVYNRWGRKVFYWNDPQKGWDGRIGGKDAAEGAYFYVIKASGYGLDPKKHDPKVRSTITLSGDINLLRGGK